jgi:hypothetical protein
MVQAVGVGPDENPEAIVLIIQGPILTRGLTTCYDERT